MMKRYPMITSALLHLLLGLFALMAAAGCLLWERGPSRINFGVAIGVIIALLSFWMVLFPFFLLFGVVVEVLFDFWTSLRGKRLR